jgi:hypothetical protein
VAKAPLKEPTGVRAALAITMSDTGNLLWAAYDSGSGDLG